MPTTYTNSLRLAKPASGEQVNTWGVTANTDYNLIDQAIAGYALVDMSADANVTLTALDGASDQSRNMYIKLTSAVSLTATRDVIVPTVSKLYFVNNATSGSQSIRVKPTAGTGITITNGESRVLFCDGTNVLDAFTDLPAGVTINGIAAGTVSSLVAGTGLSGGTITSTGTVAIAVTGVTANTYGSATAVPVLAINAQGQVTTASTAATVGSIIAGTGLSGGTITTTGTIAIATTGVAAATYGSAYQIPVIALNTQGQATTASNLQINSVTTKTADYTLAIGDITQVIEMNSGSATALTVPPNASVAFPTGTTITILRYGAGAVTITAGVGVTIRSVSSHIKIGAQYAGATLVKRGTNEWFLFGNLSA